MNALPISIQSDVPLAPLTTLQLGGHARHFVAIADEAALSEALLWADSQNVPAFVLGGGSNVIVPDAGYPGLVIRIASRGVHFADALCSAAPGEPWDRVVDQAVQRGLGGIECLSGIPGTTGATPVQNVGAYGQEVADTIRAVRVFDRVRRTVTTFDGSACGFSYRDSVFKRQPDRFVVLGVTFALHPDAAPTLVYAELRTALAHVATPSLTDARNAVLALRRRKSMVLVDDDPNRRSVGSFFTNPIFDGSAFADLCARACAAGVVARADEVPRHAVGRDGSKVPAAWLIERAGFHKGLRRGTVGISSAHTLALVHHGGGSTDELLALAREIRAGVFRCFGVTLVPEPIILGSSGGTSMEAGTADPLAINAGRANAGR